MSRARISARQRSVATVLLGVLLATTGVVGGAVHVLQAASADPAPATPERAEKTSSAPSLATDAVPAVAVDPSAVVRRQAVGGPSDFPGSLGSAPPPAIAAYQRAAAILDAASDCGLDWAVLAAIGRVESDHGRGRAVGAPLDGRHGNGELADTDRGALDDNRQWDAPVGPMRLLPATWADVAVDADDDGARDPQDLDDAALAAAVLLCSAGDLARPAVLRTALASYHRSTGFVETVLALSARYDRQSAAVPAPPALELPLPVLPDVCDCRTRPAATPSAAAIAASATGNALVRPTDATTPSTTPTDPASPSDTASPTDTAGPSETASLTDTATPTDTASPTASDAPRDAPRATP